MERRGGEMGRTRGREDERLRLDKRRKEEEKKRRRGVEVGRREEGRRGEEEKGRKRGEVKRR